MTPGLDTDDGPNLAIARAFVAAGYRSIAGYLGDGANPGWPLGAFSACLAAGMGLGAYVVPLQPATGSPWAWDAAAARGAWQRAEVLAIRLRLRSVVLRFDVEESSSAADLEGSLAALALHCRTGRARGHVPVAYGCPAFLGASARLGLDAPAAIVIAATTADPGTVGPEPASGFTLQLDLDGLPPDLYDRPGQRQLQWADDVDTCGWLTDRTLDDGHFPLMTR